MTRDQMKARLREVARLLEQRFEPSPKDEGYIGRLLRERRSLRDSLGLAKADRDYVDSIDR